MVKLFSAQLLKSVGALKGAIARCANSLLAWVQPTPRSLRVNKSPENLKIEHWCSKHGLWRKKKCKHKQCIYSATRIGPG